MIKIKHCPNCLKSGSDMQIWGALYHHAIFPRQWYFVECPSCHWCGKTKLFLWRAIRSWNREKRGGK